MIPINLAEPAGGHVPTSSTGVRALAARVGALLLGLVALAGAVAWVTTLSPVGLDRWSAGSVSYELVLDEPGTYVVFEEGAGASARRGPAQVDIGVRSSASGRAVARRPLIDDAGASQHTYDVGLHEGRAIFAFEVDRPGRYMIVSFAMDRRVQLSSLPELAVAPDGVPSRWGTVAGLVLLAGVPALAGGGLALYAGRRWPVPVGPRPELPPHGFAGGPFGLAG